MTQSDLNILLPLTILAAWACLLLLADLYIPRNRKGVTAFLAALGLAVTLGFTVTQIGETGSGFNGMVVVDGFSTFINALLLLS
ncbi:MAG TPA: hypothetical protein VI524_10960, partial [Anaerolineales bacterium]|nr:hypothetical protein [Anaerolineales bacterium]